MNDERRQDDTSASSLVSGRAGAFIFRIGWPSEIDNCPLATRAPTVLLSFGESISEPELDYSDLRTESYQAYSSLLYSEIGL